MYLTKINKCIKNSWKEKGALLGRWRLRGWGGDAAAPDSCQLSALLLALHVAQRQRRDMKRRGMEQGRQKGLGLLSRFRDDRLVLLKG